MRLITRKGCAGDNNTIRGDETDKVKVAHVEKRAELGALRGLIPHQGGPFLGAFWFPFLVPR